ncbi:MAG: PaaI family thioesterase [Polyangiaceae bacterium]
MAGDRDERGEGTPLHGGSSAVSTPLDPHLFGEASPCFGCSPTHPIGFRLRCEKHVDGDARSVRATFVPRDDMQGPPGVMHGGLVLALADEVAAWTVIGLVGRFGFTAQVSSKLARPVRIGVPVACTGVIESQSSRVVKVKVELRQAEAIVNTSELTFALLDEASAERLLGTKLPDAWRRFARTP